MLKFFTKMLSKNVKTEEKELYYEFYKYKTLESLLYFRMFLYVTIPAIPFLFYEQSGFSRIIPIIFASLTIIAIIYIMLPTKQCFSNNSDDKINCFERNTYKLSNIIQNISTISKNSVPSKKDWKQIKKANRKLYDKLLYENFLGKNKETIDVFYYARQIALFLKDAELMYVAIDDECNNKFHAHALVKRRDQVYDIYLKRSFKIDDYAKLYKMKTYKKWTYRDYSKCNFDRLVQEGFIEWCSDNGIWYSK